MLWSVDTHKMCTTLDNKVAKRCAPFYNIWIQFCKLCHNCSFWGNAEGSESIRVFVRWYNENEDGFEVSDTTWIIEKSGLAVIPDGLTYFSTHLRSSGLRHSPQVSGFQVAKSCLPDLRPRTRRFILAFVNNAGLIIFCKIFRSFSVLFLKTFGKIGGTVKANLECNFRNIASLLLQQLSRPFQSE